MAQNDAYPNPSQSAQRGIPWVNVIQSDLLRGLTTRLSIPPPVAARGRQACLVPEPDAVDDGLRRAHLALNLLDNISCHCLNMALRTICVADMGREPAREGVIRAVLMKGL